MSVFGKTMLMGGRRRWFRLPAIRLVFKGASMRSHIGCASVRPAGIMSRASSDADTKTHRTQPLYSDGLAVQDQTPKVSCAIIDPSHTPIG
jgi:hypothetical protein